MSGKIWDTTQDHDDIFGKPEAGLARGRSPSHPIRRRDMFRSNAHADQPRRNSPQQRHMLEQGEWQRRLECFGFAENTGDDVILDENLTALSEPGRKLASALDSLQTIFADPA